MRDRIFYEWAIEWSDEYGDIFDIDHSDKVVPIISDRNGEGADLCLIRGQGNEYEGMKYFSYAYVKGDVLPEEFDCGSKVPKRFHEELRRALA